MIASSGPLSIVIVPAQLSCGRRLTALRNLTSEAREAFLEQAKETGKHLAAIIHEAPVLARGAMFEGPLLLDAHR
jgi:hypothetical protein